MKTDYKSIVAPLTILFITSTALFLIFGSWMEAKQISRVVVICANALLYSITLLNLYFQYKALNNPNPNPSAIVRGVMAGSFLKLLVIAAATIIYLLVAKKERSINAVFIGMALYIVYTWLEVRISLRMNSKK